MMATTETQQPSPYSVLGPGSRLGSQPIIAEIYRELILLAKQASYL